MSEVRVLVLREIAENLALWSSPVFKRHRVFELDETDHWVDRGTLRGVALRDTISFIENGAEYIGIHVLGRLRADPSIREFIKHFCPRGVPEAFFIRLPGSRPHSTFGPWVRDVVEGLAGGASVAEIMAVLSDQLDLILGVESAHERIKAYGETEELLLKIQTSLATP